MSYNIDNDTPIGFGKLKGKPHKDLLKQCNENYRDWIINQGVDFKYSSTRQYILDNIKNGEDLEIRDIIDKIMLYIAKGRYANKQGMVESLMDLSAELKERF